MEQNSLGHRITDRYGRMKGKHALDCCVYFWIGLFVFPLPRVVTKIGAPQNCWWGSRTETQKSKRWPEGFLVIRNIADISSSFIYFLFFLTTVCSLPSRSELWLMNLKVVLLLDLLCNSFFVLGFLSIELVNVIGYHHSPQNRAEVTRMLSSCLCPASPTRPPDVQISPSSTGALLQRRATWE